MKGSFSTGQSPQRAVVPVEEEFRQLKIVQEVGYERKGTDKEKINKTV
jgi:hypothetical protein